MGAILKSNRTMVSSLAKRNAVLRTAAKQRNTPYAMMTSSPRGCLMDSLVFLERAQRLKPQPVYVLHGDEDFLKRQVVTALRRIVLGEGDHAFGLSAHAGDKAAFADIRAELETVPFLSPRRLVVVEHADPFVSQFRTQLEKYVAEPPATG